ncbi:MAG: hypothetical protein ABSC04_09140 [Syntrophobacteraceae bacterium]
MMISKRHVYILIIIIVIGTIYLCTVRDGQDWGDDFALYIHHAINIVNGKPYASTGYIYNPFDPYLSPKSYPPMFSILLAPVYKLFGFNLNMFKYEIIIFWVGSMVLLFMLFQRELTDLLSLAAVLTVGLNPWFWDYKDSVGSDIPFLFISYAAILNIFIADSAPDHTNKKTVYSISSGLLMFLAFLTRTIGIIFLPSLFIRDILTKRRVSSSTMVSCGVTLLLIYLQKLIFPIEYSYLDQLPANIWQLLTTINGGVHAYCKYLTIIWSNGYNKRVAHIVFCVMSLLAILGFIRRIRRGITLYEVFALLYIGVIVSWPARQGVRFLIPIIPMYILYIFQIVQNIIIKRYRSIGIIMIVLLISTTYVAKYTTVDYGPIKDGIANAEAVSMFDYVRNSTNKDDVFIFRKPRALSLMTGRSASGYYNAESDNALWKYFMNINVKYLIHDIKEDDSFVSQFISRNSDLLLPVYKNDNFIIYRFNNP